MTTALRRKTVKDGPTRVTTVPNNPRLHAYQHRFISGVQDDVLLDQAMENAWNVLLTGPTGAGKTTLVESFAFSRDLNFYSVSSNTGIEPSQIFGSMMPGSDGLWYWSDGGATDILRYGGVLLINEINFIPERVSTVLFQALDSRRSATLVDHNHEEVRAHRPGCWCDLPPKECRKLWVLIVADQNTLDYAGARPLNAALQNRFAIQLDWGYSPDVEISLVTSATLLKVAAGLRAKLATREIDTPVPTNALMEFERIAKTVGFDFAVANFTSRFASHERRAVDAALAQESNRIKQEITPEPPAPRRGRTSAGGIILPDGDIRAFEESMETLPKAVAIDPAAPPAASGITVVPDIFRIKPEEWIVAQRAKSALKRGGRA